VSCYIVILLPGYSVLFDEPVTNFYLLWPDNTPLEASFNSSISSELMTPYFESGKYQPISRVTLASLADLGYEVNMDRADPWLHDEIDNSTVVRHLSNSEAILRPHQTFTLGNIIHPDIIAI